jgi:hypothetical protein
VFAPSQYKNPVVGVELKLTISPYELSYMSGNHVLVSYMLYLFASIASTTYSRACMEYDTFCTYFFASIRDARILAEHTSKCTEVRNPERPEPSSTRQLRKSRKMLRGYPAE